MAPIFDTDLEEERWLHDRWKNFELWEKVEKRLEKNRRLWVLSTVILFVFLSSIPVVLDRVPKWKTLSAARQVAEEINLMKTNAALSREAFRFRMVDSEKSRFVVEKSSSCSADGSWRPVKNGVIGVPDSVRFLTSVEGSQLEIPGLRESICYDSLGGLFPEGSLQAMSFAPVNDLTDPPRFDRISIVTVNGASGSVSFN